jgi:hypothetical protein
MKKYTYIIIIILLLACNNSNTKDYFEINYSKLISSDEYDCLPFTIRDGNKYLFLSKNKYFENLINPKIHIDQYLLEKTMSLKSTNLWLAPNNILLSEGDLCIYILILRNNISYYNLLPNTSNFDTSSESFWRSIQSDINNRKYVINKIAQIINGHL